MVVLRGGRVHANPEDVCRQPASAGTAPLGNSSLSLSNRIWTRTSLPVLLLKLSGRSAEREVRVTVSPLGGVSIRFEKPLIPALMVSSRAAERRRPTAPGHAEVSEISKRAVPGRDQRVIGGHGALVRAHAVPRRPEVRGVHGRRRPG